MNFVESITLIRTILEINGYTDIAMIILNTQMESGTQGEMFMRVCSKLLGLKNTNESLYKLISKDADILLTYAKEIGYNISPT